METVLCGGLTALEPTTLPWCQHRFQIVFACVSVPVTASYIELVMHMKGVLYSFLVNCYLRCSICHVSQHFWNEIWGCTVKLGQQMQLEKIWKPFLHFSTSKQTKTVFSMFISLFSTPLHFRHVSSCNTSVTKKLSAAAHLPCGFSYMAKCPWLLCSITCCVCSSHFDKHPILFLLQNIVEYMNHCCLI